MDRKRSLVTYPVKLRTAFIYKLALGDLKMSGTVHASDGQSTWSRAFVTVDSREGLLVD